MKNDFENCEKTFMNWYFNEIEKNFDKNIFFKVKSFYSKNHIDFLNEIYNDMNYNDSLIQFSEDLLSLYYQIIEKYSKFIKNDVGNNQLIRVEFSKLQIDYSLKYKDNLLLAYSFFDIINTNLWNFLKDIEKNFTKINRNEYNFIVRKIKDCFDLSK